MRRPSNINVEPQSPDNNRDMKNLKTLWWNFRKKLGSPKLLCDSCEYDYPSACHNSKRPNVTVCQDYKKR
jgi:hypothetical protein